MIETKHMSMTLQKQILDRIKTEGVRPTPKGFFRVRDYVMWLLLGIFVAAVSIGIAMIMFMIRGADQSLFAKLGFTIPERILYSVPFFWITATIAVLGVAFINFRNTKRGYKTSARQFGLIALLVSLALGSVAYAFNVAQYIDKTASSRIPLYNSVIPLNTNRWFDPKQGLLSGVVREKESNQDFMLRDPDAVLWHVIGNEISMPSDFQFHSGDRIKLIGKIQGDDTFRVIEIRPFE